MNISIKTSARDRATDQAPAECRDAWKVRPPLSTLVRRTGAPLCSTELPSEYEREVK